MSERLINGNKKSDPSKINALNRQWERMLLLTEDAVCRHPDCYRELKSLILKTVYAPLDIRDYIPTARKIVRLLNCLDPVGKGTIFQRFVDPLKPSDICHLKWMRMECIDLLDHLGVFEDWRKEQRCLRIVR